jgi:hypothetical protein
MFTPYELSIIIHYCVKCDDWEKMSVPIWRETITRLIELDMIEGSEKFGVIYQATDKAKAYLDKLCNTPLPVKKWVFE